MDGGSSEPLLSSGLLISLTLPEDVLNEVTPCGLWPWATAQYDTSTQDPLTWEGPGSSSTTEGLRPDAPSLWDPRDGVSPFFGMKSNLISSCPRWGLMQQEPGP